MILIEFLRKEVSSSNIASIGYDEDTEILEVEFKNSGAIYQHYDVPIYVYKELMDAISHGSYFYYNIRTDYDYQKQ